MARTRQTVDVSKLEKVPLEELATWTPSQRSRYWQGVFERRRAMKAKSKVALEPKILLGIFDPKNIVQNRGFQYRFQHQKSLIIFLTKMNRRKVPFSKINSPFCSFLCHFDQSFREKDIIRDF
jgi:hypothetical protein